MNKVNFIKEMARARFEISARDSVLKIRVPCEKCEGTDRARACAPCRGTGWSVNLRIQGWKLGAGLAIFGMLVFGLAFLRTSFSPVMRNWTPHEIDPGFHLFYMSPVSSAVSVNDGIVPAWDGNRMNQVSILECSETQARVSNVLWIDRTLLLADWCDAKTYERVKP